MRWKSRAMKVSYHGHASFGWLKHLTKQNRRNHEGRTHLGGEDTVPRVLVRRKNLCCALLGKRWGALWPCSVSSQRWLWPPKRVWSSSVWQVTARATAWWGRCQTAKISFSSGQG